MEPWYRVKVLVRDHRPGLIPFTYHLPAKHRDAAITEVRRQIRKRSLGSQAVRHVVTARRLAT